MSASHIGPTGLHNHVIETEDGHKVGVTIGGYGVPLVFFHGIAMNRLAYESALELIAESGFFVVAVDAPGHGESDNLARGNAQWSSRVEFMQRVLDELGVNRAVLSGHSMGGRKAVAVAATNKDRAAAAILVSSATGAAFDDYKRLPAASAAALLVGLALAVYDTVSEQVELRGPSPTWSLRIARTMAVSTARHGSWLFEAARSIIRDPQGEAHLEILREAEIPVFVLHGRRDQVIRYKSAVAASEASNGLLIELPRAKHSWLICSPQTFAAVMQDLSENELGAALGLTGDHEVGSFGEPAGWLDPEGLAYALADPPVRARRRLSSTRAPLAFVRQLRPHRSVPAAGA